ncbi:putative quinol monooxygenase [Nocardia sp. NPDC004860]|uniref:putative quinol monooxygenase n=1 Tax=Nocardia sp. NPDC004860 TaxID=3154557 RepID=UPI0033A4B2FB
MTIQLTAVLDIAPAHTAAFEAAITTLAKAATTEPGVLDYGFWRDPAQPGRYLIRERYADQAAVDTHMALADVVAFTVLLPEWLAQDSHALLETTTDLTRIPFSRNQEGAL